MLQQKAALLFGWWGQPVRETLLTEKNSKKLLLKRLKWITCAIFESMNQTEILQSLQQAGLGRIALDVQRLLSPSIRLRPVPAVEPLTVGLSRLGGTPDLPPGFAWPRRSGVPMSFVAQIRMEDVKPFAPAADLPSAGLLSFFYDAAGQTFGAVPADQGGWQVAFHRGAPENWHLAQAPAGLPVNARFALSLLQAELELSLPSVPSQHLPSLNWSAAERRGYEAFWADFPNPRDHAALHHRMFGHPEQIQDDMQAQCALYANGLTDVHAPLAAEKLAHKADWQLLLQIDSEESLGMRWGSVGILTYWIENQALKSRQFERCWLVLQSD